MARMVCCQTVNITWSFLHCKPNCIPGWSKNCKMHVQQLSKQIFLLAPASRPALGPTQPPIEWVLGVLSPGVKHSQGVTLTTHPHLVPRLRMSRSYTSSPPCASMACSGTALLYFILFCVCGFADFCVFIAFMMSTILDPASLPP
jgi:hypothetical protein